MASKEELLRDSERRSKSNHDRPLRRLMLEAALSADITVVAQNSPSDNLGLHHAPAISHPPTVCQLLLEDSPIPALGATMARGPRSKAIPTQSTRKSAWGKGLTDGHVVDRDVRLTSDKNAMNKPAAETTATTSTTPQVSGTHPLSEFTAFQDTFVEQLLHIAKDSCILFKSV